MTQLASRNVATLRGWDESAEFTPTAHAVSLALESAQGTPVTHLRVHPLDDIDCAWVPEPLLRGAMPGIEVAGLGAIGSSALALVAATTSVHPFGRVIRLIDRDQLFTDETPLLEERQVRVFVSGCRQHVLRFLEEPAARLSPTSREAVERAVGAVGDLRRWLDLSQSDVAELCGFSLRASRYWESGETSAPRPSSVRRLFEVHAFIASLVTRFGEDGAVGWLRSPSNEGTELREGILARDGGVQVLLRELAPALFANAPRPELAPTEAQIAGELAIDDEAEPDQRTLRAPRSEPPKRPRKAPRRG